jgi:hypothetical protein
VHLEVILGGEPLDNQDISVYDNCIGRLSPLQYMEVHNEVAKMVRSLAISELTPCLAAGHKELRIDS